MIIFPKEFLWGAATSAHQVEGNNTRNDWWQWEHDSGLEERSGDACRHYSLYKDDFASANSLGHNAHRFSLEWSRIEPEEGNFSQEALAHYREVIEELISQKLQPIVTLHHFTNPSWFSAKGGWLRRRNIFYFSRYVEKVVSAFGDKVKFWVTINEPLVYVYHSYVTGNWPPQGRSYLQAMRVASNLSAAHIRAYRLIHQFYSREGLLSPMVSIAHHMQYFMPCSGDLKDKLGAYIRDRLFNRVFLDKIYRAGTLDFIGLNYYTRQIVRVKKWALQSLLSDNYVDPACQKNSLSWDIYPQGLFNLLQSLRKYSLPVIILENGICTLDDGQRWDFIRGHLEMINSAISSGVDIRGYIYWSLIDNYEWDKGFSPRFGLVEVDYSTQKRTVRESALKFERVCRTGELV
jgi:beta-glucosidase